MEDVKEHIGHKFKKDKISYVSILVLMEDVKEQPSHQHSCHEQTRFNPCFNGRCKRTPDTLSGTYLAMAVSILVLMEDVKELLYYIFLFCYLLMFQSLF